MSETLKRILKDVALVSLVFALISGAYVGFAYAERYRALTAAYISQSQAILQILQKQHD